MSDVFISYSRLDKEFVSQLRNMLRNQSQDVWIDWEAIPPSQKWWSEIQKGIAHANNFLLVMSANSLSSPICQMEIEYARQLGKRIIPILYKEYERPDVIATLLNRLEDPNQIIVRELWANRIANKLFDQNDSHLKHINYFFFSDEDDFQTKFDALFAVIRADYTHKEKHTSLELRAQEWARHQHDVSFLLLDTELAQAQEWLETSDGKEPISTDLQRIYIQASGERTELIHIASLNAEIYKLQEKKKTIEAKLKVIKKEPYKQFFILREYKLAYRLWRFSHFHENVKNFKGYYVYFVGALFFFPCIFTSFITTSVDEAYSQPTFSNLVFYLFLGGIVLLYFPRVILFRLWVMRLKKSIRTRYQIKINTIEKSLQNNQSKVFKYDFVSHRNHIKERIYQLSLNPKKTIEYRSSPYYLPTRLLEAINTINSLLLGLIIFSIFVYWDTISKTLQLISEKNDTDILDSFNILIFEIGKLTNVIYILIFFVLFCSIIYITKDQFFTRWLNHTKESLNIQLNETEQKIKDKAKYQKQPI